MNKERDKPDSVSRLARRGHERSNSVLGLWTTRNGTCTIKEDHSCQRREEDEGVIQRMEKWKLDFFFCWCQLLGYVSRAVRPSVEKWKPEKASQEPRSELHAQARTTENDTYDLVTWNVMDIARSNKTPILQNTAPSTRNDACHAKFRF